MPDEPQGSEEFAGRVLQILNDGATALMVSVGHKTGLFDTMAELPPSTSEEIAKAAGLQERYVREWLGAVTVGGIIEHDPEALTFSLPAERAAWLTRAAGPANLAATAQWIGIFAGIEDDVAERFRIGGGVPYSAFEKFHAVMAEESAAVHDATLIDGILPLVPGIIERLKEGIDVADIGCGQGHAINLMAAAFPKSRFNGIDLSEEAIAVARKEAAAKGLTNARFEARDAATLDLTDSFDFVTTFDAVHDQARPDLVLAAIARTLRPGGKYLCVDIKASSTVDGDMELPLAPMLYATSVLHCMTVSLAEGGLGLGTMWGEKVARRMLADAGFTSVELHEVPEDIANNYYVATKG